MLLYLLFWTILGFIFHFYIIFGTNLLTGGPSQNCCFFFLFQCFKEKEYQTDSKRNETFGSDLFGTNVIQRTWSGSQEIMEAAMRVPGAPPISWAPRASTDVLLPPIYTNVPRKHPGAPRKTISTSATFYIREIPSWSLRRRSARGGIDHGGPLHQLQSISDESWVVYHRPSGSIVIS